MFHDLPFPALLAAPVLLHLSLTDLRARRIPDLATLAVTAIFLVGLILLHPDRLLPHLLTALLTLAVLWLIGALYYRRTGQDGLGLGDAKLFAAGALWLGPLSLPDLLLVSALGGLVAMAVLKLRKKPIDQGIPFGPFIAYAIVLLSFLDPLFL